MADKQVSFAPPQRPPPMAPPTIRESAYLADERRRHHRLEVGLWAHCQIDGVVSQEALGDLSATGLFLCTGAALPIGARVRVVLGLPYIGGQRVCSLAGRVVWLEREGDHVEGAGVEFDQETDSADAELLRGFLALWSISKPVASG